MVSALSFVRVVGTLVVPTDCLEVADYVAEVNVQCTTFMGSFLLAFGSFSIHNLMFSWQIVGSVTGLLPIH